MLSRCNGYPMNILVDDNVLKVIYRTFLIIFLSLAISLTCHAQWSILSTDGTQTKTDQLEIADTGTAKFGSGILKPLAWSQIVNVNTKQVINPKSPWLMFNNRDQLAAELIRSDGNQIIVRWQLDPQQRVELAFPLSTVSAAFSRFPSDSHLVEERAKVRNRDHLWKVTDEVIYGSIESMSPEEIKFQDGTSSKQLQRKNITSIWFNTELSRVREPRETFYRVTLTDGSYLSATKLLMSDNKCQFTLLNKVEVKVAVSAIVQIDVEKGRAVDLGSLKPLKQQYATFAGEERSLLQHVNIQHFPLRLNVDQNQRTYWSGLGLSTGMTLTYDLQGKYQRFSGLVGTDTILAPRGNAEIVVFVDGKKVTMPNKGVIELKAIPFQVDVAGCRELTIQIQRIGSAGVHESVNLVDAKLHP